VCVCCVPVCVVCAQWHASGLFVKHVI